MPLSEEHRMWNAAPAALYQISTCLFRKMPLLQRSWKPHSWRDRRHVPIGSMYGIFTYIYHQNQPTVGKYTSPMDPIGLWGTSGIPHINFTIPWPLKTTWKSQAAKGVVEEKSLEGEAPKWMNSVVYKNLGLQICQFQSVCFIGILKVGWSIFPKVP